MKRNHIIEDALPKDHATETSYNDVNIEQPDGKSRNSPATLSEKPMAAGVFRIGP
jgi:hypothetical protein